MTGLIKENHPKRQKDGFRLQVNVIGERNWLEENWLHFVSTQLLNDAQCLSDCLIFVSFVIV